MSVSGSVPPSASMFVSAMSMPGLSTLLSSAFSFAFNASLSVLESLAPPFVSCVPVPGLSALPSMSSLFGVSVLVPGSSALPSLSGVPVPRPELSPLSFPILSFPQTLTPVPGRQKLGQWSRTLKRASYKEAPTIFAPLFPPSEPPSLLFFPSSDIGKKRSFDKAFNIDYWPLTDDHAGENVGKRKFDKTFINTRLLAVNHAEKEVDLSFAGCGYLPTIKLNRP